MSTTVNNNNENDKPRNNLVAESDLQACLKSMKSSLEDPKWQHQNDENGATLLQSAHVSLTSHVTRLVEPLSDEAYHQHVKRNIVQDDDDDESVDQVSDEEEDVISDVEFEEEELVDQEVLQRARALRQQVREASERVGKLRASVTERAVSVAQREATLLVGPPRVALEPFDAQATAQRLQSYSGEKSDKLVEMEESLKNLTTSLEEMQDKVPDTMETLQETIDTIQMHMAMEEEGTQSLSQTERAIRSRSNEGPSQSSQDDGANAAPEARLGFFLGQH